MRGGEVGMKDSGEHVHSKTLTRPPPRRFLPEEKDPSRDRVIFFLSYNITFDVICVLSCCNY